MTGGKEQLNTSISLPLHHPSAVTKEVREGENKIKKAVYSNDLNTSPSAILKAVKPLKVNHEVCTQRWEKYHTFPIDTHLQTTKINSPNPNKQGRNSCSKVH